MPDEMLILDKEGRLKLIIDSNNEVLQGHECTFTVFDEDAKCEVPGCGTTLGDVIADGRVPVLVGIVVHNEKENK